MNIAFAGFRHGHIYVLYRQAVENKDVNISYCFEENEEAKKAAEEFGVVFNAKSYDEILNDESVDAVAIGDYYSKRGKLAIEALKHGKHIICDKPICTDLAELDEIEQLAKEKGLVVACMLDLRYMPQAGKVKELIEKGEIGDIHIASFTGQHCLDYGNRPGWYFEKGKHGGTINDIAIHGIDLIRYITGKDLTKVDCARVWNAFADKEPGFADSGQFMAQMGSMAISADVSYAAPKMRVMMPTYWNFYIWGSKGMINFRYSDNLVHVYKEEETVIECDGGEIKHLEDFIKTIDGEETIMETFDVLKSQRQVLEIQKEADKK